MVCPSDPPRDLSDQSRQYHAALVERRSLSTPHSVINDSGTGRYSIAYFHTPNADAVIECDPTCTGADNPPRYPPAVYRNLVLEFYRASYFHQNGHQSAAAERAVGAVP
jgi:isopenicillin N synthase-like dioxygenase